MFHMQFEANYNLMSLLYEHEAINPILPWQLSRRFNSAAAAICDFAPWNQGGLTVRMRNLSKSQKESQTARAASVSPGFRLDTSS